LAGTAGIDWIMREQTSAIEKLRIKIIQKAAIMLCHQNKIIRKKLQMFCVTSLFYIVRIYCLALVRSILFMHACVLLRVTA